MGLVVLTPPTPAVERCTSIGLRKSAGPCRWSTTESPSRAWAASTISVVYAPSLGGAVRTVAPSRFGVLWAICTVRFQAASSIIPMPSGDGQMSWLTAFICQSWWLSPSDEPAATTMSRHDSGSSRQYAQPWSEAATKRVAMSLYAASFARRSPSAQMASCSMPTPSSS